VSARSGDRRGAAPRLARSASGLHVGSSWQTATPRPAPARDPLNPTHPNPALARRSHAHGGSPLARAARERLGALRARHAAFLAAVAARQIVRCGPGLVAAYCAEPVVDPFQGAAPAEPEGGRSPHWAWVKGQLRLSADQVRARHSTWRCFRVHRIPNLSAVQLPISPSPLQPRPAPPPPKCPTPQETMITCLLESFKARTEQPDGQRRGLAAPPADPDCAAAPGCGPPPPAAAGGLGAQLALLRRASGLQARFAFDYAVTDLAARCSLLLPEQHAALVAAAAPRAPHPHHLLQMFSA
jgi:hypothetical protein